MEAGFKMTRLFVTSMISQINIPLVFIICVLSLIMKLKLAGLPTVLGILPHKLPFNTCQDSFFRPFSVQTTGTFIRGSLKACSSSTGHPCLTLMASIMEDQPPTSVISCIKSTILEMLTYRTSPEISLTFSTP